MTEAEAFSHLALTTDPGLERLLAAEWTALAEANGIPEAHFAFSPFGLRGLVRAKIPAPLAQMWPLVQQMHSVHHVFRLVHFMTLPEEDPLEVFGNIFEQLDFPEAQAAQTFRITSLRSGTHDFSSYDMAVLTGSSIERRYGTKVNLTNFDLDIRVQVVENSCWIGVQMTTQPLSRRFERPYFRKVSLKPTAAYALLQMARIPQDSNAVLLDPLCGSGTILLEAASLYPDLEIHGSELFPEVIEGVQQNLAALNLQERIHLVERDARELGRHWVADSIQYLVTNPPFGLQLGKKLNMFWFYHLLLEEAEKIMAQEGRLVVLVLKSGLFQQVVRKQGAWEILDVLRIELGGKYLRAFAMKRKPQKETQQS